MRNLAHGEGGVQTCVLLGDDHAFIGLDTFTVTFLHLDVDDHGVAGAEFGQLALGLGRFEFVEEVVQRRLAHGYCLCICGL